jgi:hypothetical protein
MRAGSRKGDWGSAVTTAIALQKVEGCAGIHLNMPIARPLPEDLAAPSPAEVRALTALQHYQDWDSGYSKQQQTRPQTVGYGLVDSPVGLAGWIYEKMWAWTDNAGRAEDALDRDAILDNIMLYWLPAGCFLRPPVLGKFWQFRGKGYRSARSGQRVSQGDFAHAAQVGGAALSQTRPLGRHGEGRALRGMGAARSVRTRTADRVRQDALNGQTARFSRSARRPPSRSR